MQNFCLHLSSTCTKLNYHIVVLIVAFDSSINIACMGLKSLSLCDRKSDADIQTSAHPSDSWVSCRNFFTDGKRTDSE